MCVVDAHVTTPIHPHARRDYVMPLPYNALNADLSPYTRVFSANGPVALTPHLSRDHR